MGSLLRDLRFAMRAQLGNRAAAAAAVLVLAIGIGANTAVFSVVEGVLLRSLPFREPERLVSVWPGPIDQRGGPSIYSTASRFAFDVWRAQSDVFEEVAGYVGGDPVLSGLGDPERVNVPGVTTNFFRVFGAAAALGRTVLPEDAAAGATPVVVSSHAFWSSRLGADTGVLGRTLTIDGVAHTIVGVMPRGFRFPEDASLWRPLAVASAAQPASRPRAAAGDSTVAGGAAVSAGTAAPDRQPFGGFWTVARLRPGVSPERAMARLDVTTEALAAAEPAWQGIAASVVPLRDELVGEVRRPLVLLLVAVAFVLLVTCANVANIQLARAVGRSREIAIRVAIGAGRARLLRQLLTESVSLALIGGALGVLLAYWGVPLLIALGGAEFPRVDEIGVNLRVLGVAFGATVLVGLASGLAPALRASRRPSTAALKEGSGRAGMGNARNRLSDALVVAQIALTMILLAGAGLLLVSFERLVHVDMGFSSDRVLVAQLELRDTPYEGSPATIAGELLQRVRAIPGTAVAAVASGTPLAVGSFGTIEVVGGPTPRAAEAQRTIFTAATPGYFRALGIPLRRGRLFRAGAAGGPAAIVVNEALARSYFPGEDPLGKRVSYHGGERTGTIVGVVGDTKAQTLSAPAPPHIYQPFAAAPASHLNVVLRARGDPARLAGGVRAAVRAAAPDLPLDKLSTMRELMSESTLRRRFYTTLVGIFAAAALLIAAAGIYGVVSYAATRRTHELGVRLALGATGVDVFRLVLGHGGLLALVGIALGGLGALWTTQALAGMLFDVAPTDPIVLAGGAALLGAVALGASCIPGRRAARIAPVEALRSG